MDRDRWIRKEVEKEERAEKKARANEIGEKST